MERQEILLDSWRKIKVKNNLILHFNHLLDKRSNYFSLNESALEDLIEQLDHLVYFQDVSFWLTMARINELTLLCAENYANNGELSLVGDLLLNPRLILIHIRGENRPVAKKRHTLLTEQFRFAAETVPGVIEWLKTETCLEIRKEALLPYPSPEVGKIGLFQKRIFRVGGPTKDKDCRINRIHFRHWLNRKFRFLPMASKGRPLGPGIAKIQTLSL